MPRPNSSCENFPTLRLHSKQDLDTVFFPKFDPMPNSESPFYNAPLRRFNSRRPRPSVASIADIFVGSLVMAGFCREHSPRGRGLSTMSMTVTRDNMTRWRSRGIAGNRQPQSKKCLECFGSATEYIAMRFSRTQRLFSNGTPQISEDNKGDDDGGGSGGGAAQDGLKDGLVKESSSRRHWENTELDLGRRINGELGSRSSAVSSDSATSDAPFPYVENHDAPDRTVPEASAADDGSPCIDSVKFPQTSPAKETYNATSSLYHATIGKTMKWEKALETIAADKGDWNRASQREDKLRDAIEIPSVERFLIALMDEGKSNQYIFRLYRDIPSPGVSKLSKRSRGVLLRRFATPPYRRWPDVRRYLALLEDMITAGLPVSRSLWTSAIHLAGRAGGRVRKTDLERAIGIWRQMEYVAGTKSDDVVFNVLFDIAIRAGQYTVAERLTEEMKKRGLSFSRFGRVSNIYYQGMVGNVDGIRQAFDDFVASGDIVDTVVMNCLIASFIRAGEFQTAEQLYDRMMDAQKTVQDGLKTGNSHMPHYPVLSSEFIVYRKKTKKLGRLLQLSAALKDEMPEHHRALQEALPLTPDTRTFHILLSYHAQKTGNLEGFMSILRDLEDTFRIPPRGIVYLLLFEGFARFGGKRRQWTAERLREAWKACVRAVFDSKTRLSDRFHLRRAKLGWENPLSSSMKEIELPTTLSGSYMPLPSSKSEPKKDDESSSKGQEKQKEKEAESKSDDELDIDEENENPDDLHDVDLNDVLPNNNNNNSHGRELDSELDELERQVENGLFLGRRIIIAILRAFGACCSSEELIEVWLKIEYLWQPRKRRGADVVAVRDELRKQLDKTKDQRWT